MKSELIKVAEIVATCAAGIATYYYGLRPLFRKIRSYLDLKDVENIEKLASQRRFVTDATPKKLRKKIEEADGIAENWANHPDQKRPK